MTAAATTKTTPARKTAARAPQDRKPKAAAKVLPEQIPGWDLLKPFAEIPVWDQSDLYDAVMLLDLQHRAGTINESRMIGTVAKALLPFAIDEDAFLAFVSGPEGMLNAAPLVMGWMEQMGKAMPSAS